MAAGKKAATATGMALLTALGIVMQAGFTILPASAERHQYTHDAPTTGTPGVRVIYTVEAETGMDQPFRFYTTAPYDSLRLGVAHIDSLDRVGEIAWSEWYRSEP